MKRQFIISVKNDADYAALRANLRKYTGWKYKDTLFLLGDGMKIYGLEKAIDALNIKNRQKRIEYIYDTACSLVDDYNAEHGIRCVFSENTCPDCRHNSHINGCCYHCSLQSTSGCPTSNLSCKLYFCDYMKEHFDVLQMDDLDILRLLSWSQRQILVENVFTDRKKALAMLYIGSYIVFGLFSIYKIFTMKHIFHRKV